MGLSDQVAIGIVEAVALCCFIYAFYLITCGTARGIWNRMVKRLEASKRTEFRELGQALSQLQKTMQDHSGAS